MTTPSLHSSFSNEMFFSLLDQQTTIVLCLSQELKLFFANQAFYNFVGMKKVSSADNLIDLLPADACAFLASKISETNQHNNRFDQKILTTNGWQWIEWERSTVSYPNLSGKKAHQQAYLLLGKDISELKKAEGVAELEKNLAILLAQKSALSEALPLCLEMAILASDMDCGGIYLIDPKTRDLVLEEHSGFTDDYVAHSSHIKNRTEKHRLITNGITSYLNSTRLGTEDNVTWLEEGLRSVALLPIQYNSEVIACLTIASHIRSDFSENQKKALENLALQIGSVVGRFQMAQELAESKNELQSLFDSLLDLVFVVDEQGKIIEVNQNVINTLGYNKHDLLGTHFLDIHPIPTKKTALSTSSSVVSEGIDLFTSDIIKKDGAKIPVETRISSGRWGSQDILIGISRDIRERKTSEAQLREKVEEIEGFFTVSLDLLCITDLQGNFIRVNKLWEATLGHEVEELLNKNFLDLIHPDDIQPTLSEMTKLAQGMQTLDFVNRYKTLTGDWRYLEWRSQCQGSLIYAAARDVTGRKESEDYQIRQNQLLAYRNKFEEILTSLSTRLINITNHDIDSQITYALKQIGEFEEVDRSYVFKLDANNNLMSNTHEWCAPDIEPQINFLRAIPVNTFPWWMEKLNNLEDVYIPVVSNMPADARAEKEILKAQAIQSVLVVPMVSHGKLIGFIGFDSVKQQRYWSLDSILLIRMVSDILSNALSRVQIEQNLRQSEIRNKALLSAIPDLIFRIDKDGFFLDFKASSDDMLSIAPEKIIGANIVSVLPDQELANIAGGKILLAIETGQIQTMEYTMKMGNSSHVFESRFKNSGIDEVIAIVRDISDRARLEQMKSDFINRATHELRTPIATMLLMANLIDGKPDQDELEKYWNVLKSEINRERQLVEDLLTAGRLENNQVRYHIKSIDLKVILEKVLDANLLPAREKNIHLSLKIEENENQKGWVIEGDETALSQVFVNLINNAIKFTPQSGTIGVKMINSSAGINISIKDTGIGIPSEDLPMLFSRFFRGTNAIENEVQGTGIGLYIVKSILEKHGGKIHVFSELGTGSDFTIFLPYSQEK